MSFALSFTLSLLIPAFASAQSAVDPFSGEVVEKLVQSDVQLMVADTANNYARDKALQKEVDNVATRAISGSAGAASSGSGAFVGGYGASLIGGMALYNLAAGGSAEMVNALLKSGKPIKWGLTTMGSGSASIYAGAKVGENALVANDLSHLLNTDNLEKFSAEAADSMATIFRLKLDEKNTLKAAIRKEAMAKAKDGTSADLDLLEILEKANFRGQKILSDREREVLSTIRAADGDPKAYAKLSDDEKLKQLALKTILLKASANLYGKNWKMGQGGKVTQTIRDNEALMEKISLLKKASAPSGSGEAPSAADPDSTKAD